MDNKGFVKEITNIEEDFAKWYTDIVLKAELADYTDVKGFIAIRPYVMLYGKIYKNMQIRNLRSTGLRIYLCQYLSQKICYKKKKTT